ncbi:hypothetical protein HYS31_03005 [Candidatus Woesearchaeota archaeon]|nr:hypothetical protein [Candidatus Woesearchaeota archaeon]
MNEIQGKNLADAFGLQSTPKAAGLREITESFKSDLASLGNEIDRKDNLTGGIFGDLSRLEGRINTKRDAVEVTIYCLVLAGLLYFGLKPQEDYHKNLKPQHSQSETLQDSRYKR